MRKTSLDDLTYRFEPLKVFSPDPNYKVDEIELQKSIDKSKRMMEVIEKYKDGRNKVGIPAERIILEIIKYKGK